MTNFDASSPLNHQWRELLTQAFAAREYSYSPYSKYKVGAALLTKSGKIYTGCNIENAGYSATVCAERTAVFKAISEGETEFEAIAVATEFAAELTVIIGDGEGRSQVLTLSDLLPYSFGPNDLPNT